MKYRKVKLFNPGPWEYRNGCAKQTIVMEEVTLPIWVTIKLWWLWKTRGWAYVERIGGKFIVK